MRIDGLVFVDGARIDPDRADVDAAQLRGHFGLHRVNGRHELVRDPLGVHKLFFAIDGGEVKSSTFFAHLRRSGIPASRIWSVPAGHRILIDPRAERLSIEKVAGPVFADDDGCTLDDHADRIRAALEGTFAMLARAIDDSRVFVTLSGGLDSTSIAALAKEHFPRVVGVTFAVQGDPLEGSDLAAARRVACELGIELVEVIASADEVLELVDVALAYGQDWRDFNVHCALVNAVIARSLPIGSTVLTGDGMNELLADYTPVAHAGASYYDLPRLPPARLRRYLVAGLDSGDREVGVYAQRGIRVVQPYLLCADAYAALPARFVGTSDAKQSLVKKVLGERVPRFVYDRPKVRAQVGSSAAPAGTLAVLASRGLGQAALSARFRTLLGLDDHEQRRLIRAGVYRFPTQWPEAA